MITVIFEALMKLVESKTGIIVVVISLLLVGNIVQYYRVDSLESQIDSLKTQNTAIGTELQRTKQDLNNLARSAKMATEYVNTQCEGLIEFWEKILNENNKTWEDYLPKD